MATKYVNARRIAWAHDPYPRGGYAHWPTGAAALFFQATTAQRAISLAFTLYAPDVQE